MTQRPTILAVGELLAEFVAVGADGRPVDTAREAPRLWAGPFPSGAPGIAIDQAARCGANAKMFGSVGDDDFGAAILVRLTEAGVDVTDVARDTERPTGTAHVAYRGDGSRRFVFHIQGSAADRVHVGPVPAGAVLLVSGSTLGMPALRKAVLEASAAVRGAGGGVAVDPNVRPELMRDGAVRQALDGLLAGALYATPSEEDLKALYPDLTVDDAIAKVRGMGVGVVALTRGAEGAIVSSADGSWALPGHAVDAVDPTGAGDAFTATLVTLHRAGMGLREAAAFANAAGAHAVTALGPMEGNASINVLRAMVETH